MNAFVQRVYYAGKGELLSTGDLRWPTEISFPVATQRNFGSRHLYAYKAKTVADSSIFTPADY